MDVELRLVKIGGRKIVGLAELDKVAEVFVVYQLHPAVGGEGLAVKGVRVNEHLVSDSWVSEFRLHGLGIVRRKSRVQV